MKTLKKFLLLSLLIPIFVSCNPDDDNDSINNNKLSIATVENPNQSSKFLFRLDNNDLMWTSETSLPFYIPKDGQRIIANYNILTNMITGSMYDHDVRLNDVYTVLTKGIFPITPATKDSIGNDSVQINDMWIGSDYLNVEFVYPGYNKIHYINLVSDTSKVYTDGKTHLEFRHNAKGDSAVYYKSGIVSFNLKSLQKSSISSLNLVIHVNVPNKAADYLLPLTYTFGETPTLYKTPKIIMPANINNSL
ncbi:MAG: NigD-like protein [Paludibacter sp.]